MIFVLAGLRSHTIVFRCGTGGRNHFNLGTNNTDCSFFDFRDMTFSNASEAAIRLRPPSDLPPYYHGSGSTQVTVRDSKFFNNEQVRLS